jgi:hypothetical protein
VEWNGTVPHPAPIPVFGWREGTEPSHSSEVNIPCRCGTKSFHQFGGIWRNGSYLSPRGLKKRWAEPKSCHSVPRFSRTEHRHGTIPFLTFSEPNTGTEPFRDIGMEPFCSMHQDSQTEHTLILRKRGWSDRLLCLFSLFYPLSHPWLWKLMPRVGCNLTWSINVQANQYNYKSNQTCFTISQKQLIWTTYAKKIMQRAQAYNTKMILQVLASPLYSLICISLIRYSSLIHELQSYFHVFSRQHIMWAIYLYRASTPVLENIRVKYTTWVTCFKTLNTSFAFG